MNEPTGFSTDPLENLTDWANRLRQTDIALGIAEALTEYANAWQAERAQQTRWVKCSERMPTVANAPEFPYVTVVNVKDKGKIISTGIVICDLQYGNLVPLGPGFLPTGWEIVAWLENIPEFVP